MNYQELKRRCELNHISLTTVASEAGITLVGLKKGVENQTLAIKTVVLICRSLCLDPNQFCGWDEQMGDVNYGNMQKGGKKNTINVGATQELQRTIEILSKQIEEKDAQLRTKDEQIAKLIEKL